MIDKGVMPNNKVIYAILAFFILGSGIFYLTQSASSQVPPTPAIYIINVGSEDVTADKYNANVTITTNGSMVLDVKANHVIDFSLNKPTSTILGGVKSGSCDFANNYTMTGINADGGIKCEQLP